MEGYNGVNKDGIKKYIGDRTNLHTEDILVKQIDTKYDRKVSQCFQVGIQFELKDLPYKPEFWPKGVALRKLKFDFSTIRNNTEDF